MPLPFVGESTALSECVASEQVSGADYRITVLVPCFKEEATVGTVVWGASGFFRHPAAVKRTATAGHRDGLIVEEGRNVAAGAAGFGAAQTSGGEALVAWRVLGISVTGDEGDHCPALGLT
jgi:hypothetical protein